MDDRPSQASPLKFETRPVEHEAEAIHREAVLDAVKSGPTGTALVFDQDADIMLLQDLTETNARLEAELASCKQAEALARENEQRFRLLLESVIDCAIFMLNPLGFVAGWNASAARLKGYHNDEVVGTHFSRFYTPEDQEADEPGRALRVAAETGRYEKEGWRVRKDGSRFWASVVIGSIRDANGLLIGFAKTIRDTTGRHDAQQALDEAREQLFQVQKLEAVGQLTGAIAHDFNNILQGITGSLEVAQWRIAKGRFDDLGSLITGAITAANRAASLTHRLLAFARRQPLDPKPVRTNARLAAMQDGLHCATGDLIDLDLDLDTALWPTLCDPHQLDDAILNLVVNAREAMPDGGRLTISTINVEIGNSKASDEKNQDMRPGQYICVRVCDTGIGMPKHVVERAFDPFFTTKPMGQGTGLGLSMIYGFARQSEGYCKISSEVGKGTLVKLYLPRHGVEAAEQSPAAVTLAAEAETDEGEVVLVVEDEQLVRTLVVAVLSDLGYRALEAGDGQSGLAILQSTQRIDLLVTDIGLPGLNGRQMADAARKTRQDLKVLFMTGYAHDAANAGGFLQPGMAMMTKPFGMDAMANRIRAMIQA
jgi:PAS domain S-box-containing protein